MQAPVSNQGVEPGWAGSAQPAELRVYDIKKMYTVTIYDLFNDTYYFISIISMKTFLYEFHQKIKLFHPTLYIKIVLFLGCWE
jgi:hypothetical protein